MTTVNNDVIKVLADEIIRAVKMMTDYNNRVYIASEFKNYKVSPSNMSSEMQSTISSIAKNTVNSMPVDASRIDGLQGVVDTAVGQASLSAAQIKDLSAIVADITALEVKNATIDTAQIENLYASVADFIYLAADKAQLGDVDAEKITASIAEMGLANIGSADIGWAQIKDLVSDTAIIREGIGGKLFIDRLSVTEANMVSLTVGELVVKGKDNNFYSVVVGEDGTITTELKQISGSNIENETISGSNIQGNTISGTNLIENTITARELNVSKIFADEALIGAITAANINTADLFANNAFINQLQTSIISNKAIGEGIDISNNSSIVLTDQRLSLIVSGESTETNLVLTDDMLKAISDQIHFIANDIDFTGNESITLKVKSEVENETAEVVRKVSQIEQKITDEAIIETVTSSETYVNDMGNLSTKIESAESKLTKDAMETTISNSDAISTVRQEADKIYWLIERDSSASALQMTESAIDVISENVNITAEKINAIADDIQFTANESITQMIKSETIYEGADEPNAPLELGFTWLDTGVSPPLLRCWRGLDVETDREKRTVETGKYFTIDNRNGLVVEVIISVTAEQENTTIIANNEIYDISENDNLILQHIKNDIITLESNDDVYVEIVTSGWEIVNDSSEIYNKLSIVENKVTSEAIINTVSSSSFVNEMQTRIEQNTENITLTVKKDDMERYIRYTDGGVNIGNNQSTYSTLTDDVGFHIMQLGEKIGSFAKRKLATEAIRVGKHNASGSRITLREAPDGGLIFVPEGLT